MSSPDRERNVLFLHPSAESRAADRTLLQLVGALDRTRWSPVVLLPRRGPLIGGLEELGAKVEVGSLGVIGEGFAPTRALSFIARLPLSLLFVRRMIRRYKPAIVHTHTTAVVGGALGAHLFATGRHIWHIHRALTDRSLRTRATARLVQLLTDNVVCSSSAAKDALEAQIPQIAEKCRLVRNAVDDARLAPQPGDRAALRNEFMLDDDSTLVVVIGRLDPSAGHQTVLDAAKKLRYTHPDTRFLFAGDSSPKSPQTAKALARAIESMGLEGVVVRRSSDSNLARIYAAADIVCIPSLEPDPFQVVALEAMAAERPVVATDTLGRGEFIHVGTSGLLFEPGDADRLAWMLGSLSSDVPRRLAMGRAAREVHSGAFLIGRFKNEFDRVWSQSVKRTFVLPAARVNLVHLVLGKSNPERLNGINQVVHQMAEAQIHSGLDVALWGITKDPSAPTTDRAYPTRFFAPAWTRFRTPRALREAIEDLDTTAIVHMHGAFLPEMWSAARRLRKRGIPYVLTLHGAYRRGALEKNRLRKAIWLALFEKNMLAKARAVQVLSGRELVDMEKICSLDHVRTVPNGQQSIPPASTDPSIGSKSAEPKRPVFAFCGRISAWTKGLDVLVEGFARYVAARGAGSLWIIGDGPDRAMLEERAEELGVGRRVTFFGAQFAEEKLETLRASDVFVHPSRHEGMPTAVLEAGALGLPLAVSVGTNLDREVRHYDAGSVFTSLDAPSIARDLDDLEREFTSGHLDARGRHAAEMVETLFAWPRIAALIARELYGLDGVDDPDAEYVPASDPVPLEPPGVAS